MAVAAGTVTATVESFFGYGYHVVVDHGAGYTSLYAHFRSTNAFGPGIVQGARVEQGQVLGYADNTGNSSGDHLHLSVYLNGAAYKPEPMSGQFNFHLYGACRGVSSPSWISRPVRWPAGNFYTSNARDDIVHLCCDDYARPWRSNGNGLFTLGYFNPGPGYNMNQGSWQSSDYELDADRDLVHLCCTTYVETWRGTGGGSFTLNQYSPNPSYGVQLGSWQSGRFAGGGMDGLMHLCCGDYAHLWLPGGSGSWGVSGQIRPWPGYGMQSGSWHTGDFDGNGLTDLFHAWGGDTPIIWLANGSGGFTYASFQPWPGYGVAAGQWKVADFNGDGKSDLIHLWGATSANTWIATTPGQFNVFATTMPPGGYGVQQGHWLAGRFNNDGYEDLIHICCAGYVRIWLANVSGQFNVTDPWAPSCPPWCGYGMLEGSWHRGDFTGDGRMDLLHAWGGSSANTWKAKTDGTFDVTGYSPQSGYCILC